MSTHRSTKAVAHRPSQSSLRALDERLQMLRAEARKGLGSKDVRRELIKEELRRPAPPPSVCAGACARGARVRSHTANSASGGSRTTSAGVDADIGDIPPAWLEGKFHLESVGDIRDGGEAALASTNELSTEMKSIAPSHLTSCPPPVSSDILRMYRSLCTVAEEVDYDVSLEEKLHKVEVRDRDTGLATTWRTRRSPPALWPCSFSTAMLTPAGSGVQQVRPPAPGNLFAAVMNGSTAGANQLYTLPASRHSTDRVSAPGRLAASRSVSLPLSEASVIPTPASSAIISTGNVIGPTPRSSGGGAGTSSSLSTEGSVVERSSAATYAKALRQLVHAQRRQVTLLGGATPQLNTFSAVWSGNGDNGSDVIPGVVEWRAHMTAPVTLAVCSSCDMWFERPLQKPHELHLSAEGLHKAEGDSKNNLGWRCPRCGHVEAEVCEGLSTDSAVVGAEPRWAWGPGVVAGASTGASQALLPTSVGTFCSSEALTRKQRPCPAQTSQHRSTAATRSETCGTDGVEFTGGDEGESFAALVASIRASRARDHRSDGAINHMSPSAAESVFSRAAAHGDLPPACTVTGMSGKATTLASAATAADGAPAEPFLWTTPTALGQVNPVAVSLRVALSHPYFDDLWAIAMEGRSCVVEN